MDQHTTHKWITQFTQQLKNETMQKWLATVNAFINQKSNQIIITMKYNGFNSHMKFEST